MQITTALRRAGVLMLLLIAWFSWRTPDGAASQAGPTPQPDHGSQAASGQVVAKIALRSPADLAALAARLDIWETHPDYLIAMLSPQTFIELQNAGYQLTLDTLRTGQLDQSLKKLPGQISGIPSFPCYRTVEETQLDLATLASEHPDLARWVDIGDSWEKVTPSGLPGYDLNVLILTNQNRPGPKPVFFLMAEIHARELVTAETATRFAEYLVNQYGIDPRITALLDHYEIHILPLSNPDGRKLAEAGYFWRKNTDNDDGCTDPNYWGTDLNRNHNYQWGSASSWACDETYQGPTAASEPETQAIQEYMRSIFQDQRGPLDSDPAPADASGAMITLHSYGDLVLWPWGWTNATAPNDSQLATLGRKLAYFNNYTPAQSIYLYPTYGTSDDWAYGELGVAAFTIEMGTFFFQDCGSFDNTIYPDNLEALLYAVQSARRPYQNPAGPDSLAIQLNPPAVLQGDSASLTATADDTRYKSNSGEPSQAIAAARFSLDTTAWINPSATLPMAPADGSWNTSQETLTASLDTTNLALGRHTVFVESQDAAGNWGVPGAGFLCVSDDPHSPFIGVGSPAREANPGETISYHLWLENLGTVSDIYTLTLDSTTTWPAVVLSDPGSLEPCTARPITVEVSIPAAAFGSSTSVTTLTATSQADPTRSYSLDLTSSVHLDYKIELNSLNSLVYAAPGETITHTVLITNGGNITTTYTASIGGNLWPTDPPPPSITLAPGEALGLALPVHIPADVTLGSSDVASLSLQSQEYPGQLATVLLTTRAWWRYYFPFGAIGP